MDSTGEKAVLRLRPKLRAKTYSFYLDTVLMDQVEALAKKGGVSKSEIAEALFRVALKQFRGKEVNLET